MTITRRTVIRLAVFAVLVAAIGALYFTPLRAYMTREHVRTAVEHLRGAWYGPIAFVVSYAVGCIFAIPATLFILAAGVIWGWAVGGTYALIGGVLGATVSCLVGRFIGEGLLTRFGRLGRAVEKQVEHAGFKSLLVLRLIPLFPFAVLNYGSGVAGVRLVDFVTATLVGLAPSTFVFAYCSDSLFNGTMTEGDALKRMLIVAALMLSIVLVPALVKKMMVRGAQPPAA